MVSSLGCCSEWWRTEGARAGAEEGKSSTFHLEERGSSVVLVLVFPFVFLREQELRLCVGILSSSSPNLLGQGSCSDAISQSPHPDVRLVLAAFNLSALSLLSFPKNSMIPL